MARDFYQSTIVLRNEDGVLVPLSGVEITVQHLDGSPATIYQARTGASQGPTANSGATNGPNPFITGPSGAVEFWADGPEEYNILIEDTQGPPRIVARTDGWNAWPAADGVVTLAMLAAEIEAAYDAAYLPQDAVAEFWVGHSLLVPGEVRVPGSGVDVIPKFFIPRAPTLQTLHLVGVIYQLSSGTATFAVQKNGVNVTGLAALAADNTEKTNNATDTPEISHSDDLRIVVSAVASTPMDLSVTLIVEHTVNLD